MKSILKALLFTSVATAGTIYLLSRRFGRKNRLIHIADEGYETANDILYPSKTDRRRLHYGPVLPQD